MNSGKSPLIVVTVCDDAAENCPIWLGEGKFAISVFLIRPKQTGTDDEKLQVFRQVRDDIKDSSNWLICDSWIYL